MSQQQLVTIASYTDAIEANLARGRLEAEGVYAFVADDNLVWASWSSSQMIGGVKIRVRAEDQVYASEVIASFDSGDYALDKSTPTCPSCGAQDTKKLDLSKRVAILVLFTMSLPLPWISRLKCNKCKTIWSE